MNLSTKAGFALQIAATCTVLAACAHTPAEPKVRTVTVSVEVPVACLSAKNDPGPPPAYADDNLPAGSAHVVERTQRRFAANEQRKARLAVVEPVIAACR